ncbi:non-ribosomal peptide synthetase [Runella sp.]|uniref:non-ribosomal peptide synthetase n=1 Tax=Runella sp. TaxID=1960881 RepID=UPI003D0E1DE6
MYHFTPIDYNPFEGTEIEKAAPATESQKEIFISTLIGEDDANRAYNESFTLLFTGDFNVIAFRQAFDDLVKRHESLRTTISANGEKIITFKTPFFQLEEEDISGLEASEREAHLRRLADLEADTPLDIVKGPLFRPYLVKTGNDTWQFTLTGHHIIFDGWSLGILLQDLGKLYSAYYKNDFPKLPAVVQYSQYAIEEYQFQKTEEYTTIKNFWIKQFKDNTPVFDFPTDFQRPATRSYQSRRNDYPIDLALAATLKKVGAKNGSSFITTLIAAFEIFLHKASGKNDVIFGLPTAGQSVTGNTYLIGHCVNMLPIRSHLNPSLTFAEYLRNRKSAILDCYEHQQITFGSLLKEINVPRDPSRVTLVPVSFNVDLGMTNDVYFEGLSYKLISNPRHYETFDFFLNASGSESEMIFEWSYNTNLYTSDTILKSHRHLETILQLIAENPDIQIHDLPGVSPVPNDLAYEKLNDTYKPYPSQKTVDQLISEVAAANPSSTAINFKGTKISYKELDEKANQFAHYLIKNGINHGDIVGLSMERSTYLPVAILGISKAGAVFQPIDPDYPVQRINYILQDGGAKTLITSLKYKHLFESALETISIEEIIPQLKNHKSSAPTVARSSSDLIYILHTSGSTGKPKGVQIEHRNAVSELLGMKEVPGMQANDRILSITNISFDIFYFELFLPLLSGATMFMIDSGDSKDAREIVECVHREKITYLQTTPSVWNSILEVAENRSLPVKALCGGEALSKDLIKKMLRKVNELWNVYGPTETTIWATAKKISEDDEIITVGKPIQNMRVYLLDEYKQLVPAGSVGEIYIAGENVGRGYINQPTLTAERFVPDTVLNLAGQRMYQSGDLGKLLENGEIQCLGRIDHQLKVNGFRIEPQEIEYSMTVAHPGVRQAVIKPFNRNNHTVLAAFYTLENDGEVLPATAWKQLLKAYLPGYMVPEYYVALDEFPLTPNAKVDKNSLKVPESLLNRVQESNPLTPTESTVMSIWREALKNEHIELDGNFFEIGGHSLVAAQVMHRIHQVTGKKLPLAILFESATVRTLAAAIDQKEGGLPYKSLVPIRAAGSKTPLFMVHGAGLNVLLFSPLVKYFDEDQPIYGIQARGLDGRPIEADTIEGLAAIYNKEILEANLGDEYAIVGYSLGGIIAFEMAKQLKALGKKVKLLGTIDTFIDNEDYHLSTIDRYKTKLLRQPKKLNFILQNLIKDPKETIRYQAYISKVKLKSMFGNAVTEEAKELTIEDKINQHYEKAYLKYKLTPYDDTICLFRVSKRIYYIDDPVYLGWKPYTPKGIIVTNVPGDHKTFLLPPNDKAFAKKLQMVLNQIVDGQ